MVGMAVLLLKDARCYVSKQGAKPFIISETGSKGVHSFCRRFSTT